MRADQPLPADLDHRLERLGREQDASSLLAHRALVDGRLLVDNDPRRRLEVVEAAFRRNLDEPPLRDALDRGLADRVRKGRFAR